MLVVSIYMNPFCYVIIVALFGSVSRGMYVIESADLLGQVSIHQSSDECVTS